MKKESIATGFVKPKTTALFFDKLWLPQNDIIDYQEDVPSEILFQLNEDFSDHPFETFVMANTGQNLSVFSRYTYVNCLNLVEVANKIRELPPNGKIKYSELSFYSSQNRNTGIKKITESIKYKHGIDVVPIYIDALSFEKDFLSPINESFYSTSHPLAVAMDFVPSIVEDTLEWKQVLEIRKDRQAMKKLRKFRTWITVDLLGCSKEKIEAQYVKTLEEYKSALKKHGVVTATGTFTILLDAARNILLQLGNNMENIWGIGAIEIAGLSVFALHQCYDYFEKRNKPIAYIYDLIQRAKN